MQWKVCFLSSTIPPDPDLSNPFHPLSQATESLRGFPFRECNDDFTLEFWKTIPALKESPLLMPLRYAQVNVDKKYYERNAVFISKWSSLMLCTK